MHRNIYNDFSASGVFPESWRDCKVVAIPKPEKTPEEAASYRPICLLSCMRKLFENMLKSRLDHWIEFNGKASNTQYGFKNGFGTTDCIAVLATDVTEIFAQSSSGIAVFMDIQITK